MDGWEIDIDGEWYDEVVNTPDQWQLRQWLKDAREIYGKSNEMWVVSVDAFRKMRNLDEKRN